MKNKDFIPEKFYSKMELNNRKNEKRIIVLFLLINLALLPETSKEISKINKKTPVINDNIKKDKSNLNHVSTWIKNIFRYDVEEAYITNDKGEIVVDDINKVKELNLDNSITINDINLDNDNKCKLGVSLNE